MLRPVMRFIRSEPGTTAVEYAVVLAVLVLSFVAGTFAFQSDADQSTDSTTAAVVADGASAAPEAHG